MLGIEQDPQFRLESKVPVGTKHAGHSGERVGVPVENVEAEENLGTGTVGGGDEEENGGGGIRVLGGLEEEEGGG